GKAREAAHAGRRRPHRTTPSGALPSWTASARAALRPISRRGWGRASSGASRKPYIETLERAQVVRGQAVRCADCSIDLVGHRPRRTTGLMGEARQADQLSGRVSAPELWQRRHRDCPGKESEEPILGALSNRACEDAYR